MMSGWQTLGAWAVLIFGALGVYGVHAWAVRPNPPPPPPPPPAVCQEFAVVVGHLDATRSCVGGGLMAMVPMSDGLLAVHCSCPALHTPDGGTP